MLKWRETQATKITLANSPGKQKSLKLLLPKVPVSGL